MIASVPAVGQNAAVAAVGGVLPRLDAAARVGLIGDTAQYFEQHSGADYEPLALGLLAELGAYLGARSWIPIPAPERQYPKLFGVVVGPSSGGKEQVIRWPLELLGRVDPNWADDRMMWGISSGEGLVEAIQAVDRDANKAGEPGQVLIALGEIGQLMAQLKRDGSTTLPILLRAWDDDGRLQVPTRKDPLRLDRSHIGLMALTTPQQFKRGFDQSAWESGFGNRFMVAYNSGTKPPSAYDSRIDSTVFNQLVTAWQQRLARRPTGPMGFTANGQAFWDSTQDALWQAERDGGDRAGRIRAKVLRIAMIYAVAEGMTDIDEPHLRAGIAWLDYHAEVLELLLGSTLGTDAGDTLAQYFADHPGARMSRSEISAEVFQRHCRAGDLTIAIKSCLETGRLRQTYEARRTRGGGVRAVVVYEGGSE